MPRRRTLALHDLADRPDHPVHVRADPLPVRGVVHVGPSSGGDLVGFDTSCYARLHGLARDPLPHSRPRPRRGGLRQSRDRDGPPPDDEREGRDPEPWRLFLASIGTCMASFVAARCREEGVSTDGIEIVQRQAFAESDRHPEIDVEIRVPPDFPPPAGRPRARRLRLHRQTHHRGGPTILDFAADELETIDFIQKGDVLDSVVIRMPKTYPAYFGTYGSFDLVREYTDRIENLFLIGRNGMHRYNNSDHSMLTAMMAVDNIANGVSDKSNIWNVNIDDDYHEEK